MAKAPSPGIAQNVPFTALTPHPKNPNVGNVDAIAESIRVNGWHGSVVAQTSTGHILVGNHRVLAAQKAGLESVPIVHWVDVSDETATRILIADNRVSDLHTYDDDQLLALLQELSDQDPTAGLAGTGFTIEDLEGMLAWDTPLADRPSGNAATGGVEPDKGLEGRKDRYTESGARSLILELSLEEFEQAINNLAAIRKATGEQTNTQVVTRLLNEAAAPDATQ